MTGHEPGRLEPLEMHVHEGAAKPDLSRELTHVNPSPREDRKDPQPVRIGERGENAHELIAAEFR